MVQFETIKGILLRKNWACLLLLLLLLLLVSTFKDNEMASALLKQQKQQHNYDKMIHFWKNLSLSLLRRDIKMLTVICLKTLPRTV